MSARPAICAYVEFPRQSSPPVPSVSISAARSTLSTSWWRSILVCFVQPPVGSLTISGTRTPSS